MFFLKIVDNIPYLRVKLFSFFFSSRRRHTRFDCDWSSDVCSSDLRFVSENNAMIAVRSRILLVATALLVLGQFATADNPHGTLALTGADREITLTEIGRASCRERV